MRRRVSARLARVEVKARSLKRCEQEEDAAQMSMRVANVLSPSASSASSIVLALTFLEPSTIGLAGRAGRVRRAHNGIHLFDACEKDELKRRVERIHISLYIINLL